jgi:hypothetical protein
VLVVEQVQRQAMADRQALLARGVTEDLPTVLSAQQHFDDWLTAEEEPAELLTPEQVARREELMALGVGG